MADKEVLGENIVFDSFESNIQEEISPEEAKAQEVEAVEAREEEDE